jgi:hypothetical protein
MDVSDKQIDDAIKGSGFVSELLSNAGKAIEAESQLPIAPQAKIITAYDLHGSMLQNMHRSIDASDRMIASLKNEKLAELDRYDTQSRDDLTAMDLSGKAEIESWTATIERLESELKEARSMSKALKESHAAGMKDARAMQGETKANIAKKYDDQITTSERTKAAAHAALAAVAEPMN